MNTFTDTSLRLACAKALLVALALVFAFPVPAVANETVYVLFRHAEKATQSPDPGLNEQGKERALALAAYLQKAGVTKIFSSDYQRTRETVEPLSNLTGIEIELYDPRDLEAFARELKEMSGTIAVCGHSDTTPQLASLVSGQVTEPIPETEYGRLYTVVTKMGGETTIRVSEIY
ncbi:SixA phosphatase family protein [Elongatibacter sediminis]|uniref:Phosphoglycerate mutase family protein n=1 Tax=Elongatibacter sediminis TaxID=3119006 RepID=A0AAW9RHZ7_9GAMM